jgi:hypothetical protein
LKTPLNGIVNGGRPSALEAHPYLNTSGLFKNCGFLPFNTSIMLRTHIIPVSFRASRV